MKSAENSGYIKWLEAQGVVRIAEQRVKNNQGKKKPDAKNTNAYYYFANNKDCKDFCDNNLGGNYDSMDITPDGLYTLKITAKVKNKLKESYLEDQPPLTNIEQIDRQLELIREAKAKVEEFNKLSSKEINMQKSKDEGFQISSKAFDKIGMVAKMLRNKSDSWTPNTAMLSVHIAQNVYYALNYNYLSNNERDNLEGVINSYQNKDGPALWQNEVLASERMSGAKVADNVSSLLNGGERKFITPNSMENPDSTKAKKAITFHQPRFLPDKNGLSETDELVIHAGGMFGHTAYRVLNKEKDSNTLGGYKYFYTKADGGGGLEWHNGKAYGLYTTEIVPAFRRDFFGNYVKLTDEEKKDPNKYQQYMQDTLQHLLETERLIEFCKNPNLAVDNGESKGITDKAAKKWNQLNDIINTARGQVVENRTFETSYQMSGNCSVYSSMLLASHFVGAKLGFDMIQDTKSYNHHDVMLKLNKLERSLEQQRLSSVSQKIAADIDQQFVTAIKNGKTFNDKDPLTYLLDNNLKIEGMHPVAYAAINGYKIQNQDPIVYAINNKINLDGMHPLIWTVTYNKNHMDDEKIKVADNTPLIWALRHPELSQVEGMSFLKYQQTYEVDKKTNIIKEMKEAKIDILSIFTAEYDALIHQKPQNKVDIKELENYYNSLTSKIIGSKSLAGINDSPLIKLLNQYSDQEFAKVITSPSFTAQFQNKGNKDGVKPTELSVQIEDMLHLLPLPIIHKFVEAGRKLSENEEKKPNAVEELFKKVIDKICNLFSKNKLNKEFFNAMQDFQKAYVAPNKHKIPTFTPTLNSEANEKMGYVDKVLDKMKSSDVGMSK